MKSLFKSKQQIFWIVATMVATSSSVAYATGNTDALHHEPFYVNGATNQVKLDPDSDKIEGVTCVSEGLWALKYPDGYQFYTLQGLKFTDYRWQLPGTQASPRMSRWGMIVKQSGASYKAPYTLVKPNGAQTALPANWTMPTKFVDSLAIIRVADGFKFKQRYITPDLKIAFPDLEPYPQMFEGEDHTIPPVSEGLRAYCTKVNGSLLWGYIDEAGKIVIQPQFREARSFHCGLAQVKDMEDYTYFITHNGNKAFEPKWDKYARVSDFDHDMCATSGERHGETDYYNTLGEKVNTLYRGTPLHKGRAYHVVLNKVTNKNEVHRTDDSFSDLGIVDISESDFNPPSYDEKDIAHFSSRMVDNGPCNSVYFYNYSVGMFSKEGYAPAAMTRNGGSTTIKGIIDTDGYFRLIYSTHTKQ